MNQSRAGAFLGDGLLRATELALFGVTATAILGMHLLFADGSFFAPLLLQAIVAHVTLGALRRFEVRLLPAGLIACGAAVVSITWTQYLDTTLAFLPAGETLSTIDRQLEEAWRLFQDVRAPAPVVPGFIATTSLAVWVIVFIADWGAFRTGVSFEALLPPATLFLFAAVLGEPGGSRAPGAALFVAASLVFLLLHRTWRQEGTSTWAAMNREQGRWYMLSAGSALAAIPVVASAVVGPNLPGADDPPIIPWKQLTDEEDPRVVISPLVDIRSRLIDQSDLEVFKVKTDDPTFDGAYWRLTALDRFDGRIWRSSYDTDRAEGELPRSTEAPAADTTTVTQTISISALGVIWLPAAFEPVTLDPFDSTEVDYDEASVTLIVDKDVDNSDGLVYTVTSHVPTWTDEQLQQAPAELPKEIRDRYLQLPEGFSERVRQEALAWTADAETPYDKALALMTRLREDFEYDQSVQPGHSEDALEDFLFTNRRGYCEQFAGAFAAMARSVGLPTRVAVGFTKGEREPNDPTLWRVKGRNAHAWAEVFFPEYGWVTFDPTPGRAPVGAEAWLGVPENQAGAGGGAGTGTTTATSNPSPAPAGGGPQPDQGVSAGEVDAGEGETTVQPGEGDEPGLVPPAIRDAVRPIGLGALAYLVLVPLGLVVVRYGRRLRAREPAARVDLAWHEVTDQATASGVALARSLTVSEQAQRMRAALPEVAEEISLVSRAVERINYAEITPTPEQAAQTARAAASVVKAAARRQLWHERVRRYLDIRRLIPQPDRARRSVHGVVRGATSTTGSRRAA